MSTQTDASVVKHQCDLLVTSTDSFLAEALVTIGQLRKLGLSALFDCHLLVGDSRPHVDGFNVLNRAAPGTWSSELRQGLQQLTKPYVLTWLDDFTPLSTVAPSIVMGAIARFIRSGGNYLRLNPTPGGHGPPALPGMREILPGELYRASTIYPVWKRETLLALLDDCESAWLFELRGSDRSDRFRGFYACEKPMFTWANVVIKGAVDPRAERALNAAGVETGGLTRRRMTTRELGLLRLKELRSEALRLLPWRARRPLRNLFGVAR